MKYILNKSLIGLLICFTIFSCDLTQTDDVLGTNTQEMAGEWFLQLKDGVDSTLYVDYSSDIITTSNTAANVPDKMWMNDPGHFFGFRSVINSNQGALTFEAKNVDNVDYDDTHKTPPGKPVVALTKVSSFLSATPYQMLITNGKIVKNGFTAPSKTKTDFLECKMTGIYKSFNFIVDSFKIVTTGMVKDTTVVWKLRDVTDSPDGPYIITGYKRTGFKEDEH